MFYVTVYLLRFYQAGAPNFWLEDSLILKEGQRRERYFYKKSQEVSRDILIEDLKKHLRQQH